MPERPPLRPTAPSLRFASVAPAALCLALLSGCPSPQTIPPLDLPRTRAVELLNRNNARISRANQAKAVTARGYFTDDRGRKHSFNLQGGLLYHKPRSLYFDLRQLGQTVMRFGSNATHYWLWIKPQIDTFWWGTYVRLDELSPQKIPIRPDLLIEALGFEELPVGPVADAELIYRVTQDHNQFLWTRRDPDGRTILTKEYWLDRRPPHLTSRILARDARGRVTFQADLDDYRPIRQLGALAAHRIVLRSLDPEWVMDLRIGKWVARENVTPEAAAFRRPPDRPKTFCVD